jgi:hypothetical protein
VAQLESATQLLAAQVRALITERDRLSGRIALLESNIDDMSGAIKKQAAATAAVLAAKDNPPTPNPKTQAVSPPGVGTDKDTTASIPPNPFPKPDIASSSVPMPPARIANASLLENDQPAPKQAEFGLDLGGGATVDGLRLRWLTVKANFGPLLSGLRRGTIAQARQAIGSWPAHCLTAPPRRVFAHTLLRHAPRAER